MMQSWKRIAATLVALVCVAALAPAAAQACSCALRTPETVPTWLREGKPAVIGEVVAVQRVGEEPPPPPEDRPASPLDFDSTFAYTVRVERAFNAELGAETTIVASSNGAMCGIAYRVGQRFGTFLGRRSDGAWGASLCSSVDPAELIAAATPQPPILPPPPGPPATPVDPASPPAGPEAQTAPLPTLQARLGARVAAGGSRAGTGLQRLPARARQRIRLRLDAAARNVRFAFARADGKRLGALRAASVIAGSRRTAWAARLPRVLPSRADRLLVTVGYGAGKRATFAVGLGQPSQASAAGALAAAVPPCPFPLPV